MLRSWRCRPWALVGTWLVESTRCDHTSFGSGQDTSSKSVYAPPTITNIYRDYMKQACRQAPPSLLIVRVLEPGRGGHQGEGLLERHEGSPGASQWQWRSFIVRRPTPSVCPNNPQEHPFERLKKALFLVELPGASFEIACLGAFGHGALHQESCS